jgi:hypothetical protein
VGRHVHPHRVGVGRAQKSTAAVTDRLGLARYLKTLLLSQPPHVGDYRGARHALRPCAAAL